MQKNGFTLVELIAVITVLAVMLVLTIPAIFKARDNTLKGLSNEQERNIKDAGMLLGIDLDDYASDVFNCTGWLANDNTSETPYCIKTSEKWTEVKVTVKDLVEHKYFRDDNNHCKGTLTIKKSSEGDSYKVDLGSDISCS